MPRDFRKIQAWQLADDLAFAVYRCTDSFPQDERYGLTQQLRRAVVSVPSNIAEGSSRGSRDEYHQFCTVARGSLAEARYQLHLAHRLGYLQDEQHAGLEALADRIGAALHGLLGAIRPGR